MKFKLPYPGIELGLLNSFPMMINILPNTLLIDCVNFETLGNQKACEDKIILVKEMHMLGIKSYSAMKLKMKLDSCK